VGFRAASSSEAASVSAQKKIKKVFQPVSSNAFEIGQNLRTTGEQEITGCEERCLEKYAWLMLLYTILGLFHGE